MKGFELVWHCLTKTTRYIHWSFAFLFIVFCFSLLHTGSHRYYRWVIGGHLSYQSPAPPACSVWLDSQLKENSWWFQTSSVQESWRALYMQLLYSTYIYFFFCSLPQIWAALDTILSLQIVLSFDLMAWFLPGYTSTVVRPYMHLYKSCVLWWIAHTGPVQPSRAI